MSRKLGHRQVNELVSSLANAKIIDLDAPIRQLIEPIATSLGRTGVGEEVGFHVLCCDEYFLVTELTSKGNVEDVRQIAEAIRSALGQAYTRQG